MRTSGCTGLAVAADAQVRCGEFRRTRAPRRDEHSRCRAGPNADVDLGGSYPAPCSEMTALCCVARGRAVGGVCGACFHFLGVCFHFVDDASATNGTGSRSWFRSSARFHRSPALAPAVATALSSSPPRATSCRPSPSSASSSTPNTRKQRGRRASFDDGGHLTGWVWRGWEVECSIV